jgi:hypothetical protein
VSKQIMETHNGDRAEVDVCQQNTIRKALKAAKAIVIAVGGIATSLLLGTTSLASTNQIRNSIGRNVGTEVPSPAVRVGIDKKGGERNGSITLHNAARSRQETLKVEYVPPTRPVVVNTQKSSDSSPGREGKGKLTLVNDRQTPMLIYIKGPSAQGRPRYAYLPGCTTRQLIGHYSTGWRGSTDMVRWTALREIRGGRLEVRASSVREGVGLSCQYGGGSATQTRGVATRSGEGADVQAMLVTYQSCNAFCRATNRITAATRLSEILGNPKEKFLPTRDRNLSVSLGMDKNVYQSLVNHHLQCATRPYNNDSCQKQASIITQYMDFYAYTTLEDMRGLVQQWTLGRHNDGKENDEMNARYVAWKVMSLAMHVQNENAVEASLKQYFKHMCGDESKVGTYVQTIMRLRRSYRESAIKLQRRIAYMPMSQPPGYVVAASAPVTLPFQPSRRNDTGDDELARLANQSCNIHQRSGNPGKDVGSRI